MITNIYKINCNPFALIYIIGFSVIPSGIFINTITYFVVFLPKTVSFILSHTCCQSSEWPRGGSVALQILVDDVWAQLAVNLFLRIFELATHTHTHDQSTAGNL